jgi:NADPH-dependent ferric siderophore reductase
MVGDETAVPAIASILATLPSGYVGRALVEVPDPLDVQVLRSDADVEVTWLTRGSRPRGELLRAAVRSAVPPGAGPAAPSVEDVPADELLWELAAGARVAGTPYTWVAGEAAVVRDLRRYLVGEAGLPRSSVTFMGYWRAS